MARMMARAVSASMALAGLASGSFLQGRRSGKESAARWFDLGFSPGAGDAYRDQTVQHAKSGGPPPPFLPFTDLQAQALFNTLLPIGAQSDYRWREACTSCPPRNETQGQGFVHYTPTFRRSLRPKRIAVLLVGESFRASAEQHERRSCGPFSVRSQLSVVSDHLLLFEKLEAEFGYVVDAFGVTSSCSGDTALPLDGAAMLSKLYKKFLRMPVITFPEDRLPNAAQRKTQMAVLLQDHYRQRVRATYDYLLVLRWDLRVRAANFKECFLGDVLLGGDILGPGMDWDRTTLVPLKFQDCWKCLIRSDKVVPEDEESCEEDEGTVLARDTGTPTKCRCENNPATPINGTCWRRHCGWDVCLNAFPPQARTVPRTCAAEAMAGGDDYYIIGEKADADADPVGPLLWQKSWDKAGGRPGKDRVAKVVLPGGPFMLQ